MRLSLHSDARDGYHPLTVSQVCASAGPTFSRKPWAHNGEDELRLVDSCHADIGSNGWWGIPPGARLRDG